MNGVFRSWEDVRFLKKNWEGPLIIKGILSVEVCGSSNLVNRTELTLAGKDAEIAVDEGIDGIIVSNHGTSSLRLPTKRE